MIYIFILKVPSANELPVVKQELKQPLAPNPRVLRPHPSLCASGNAIDLTMGEPITLQSIFDMMQQMKLDMISHFDSKMDSLGPSLKKLDDSLHMLGDQVNKMQQKVNANEDNIAFGQTYKGARKGKQ